MTPTERRAVVRQVAGVLAVVDAGRLEATPAERAYLAGIVTGLGAEEPPLPEQP